LITYPDDFILNEAKELVLSIPEYEIAKVFTQKYLNHAKYGIGSGKAEEIETFVKETKEIDEIIVDEHLTSKQMFNLENLTGVPVKDRERLILDIFFIRATTVEAKLQIQLAEIEYKMPRVRENAKLSSLSKERAGKGGKGEYIVDVHFRDLKRQMSFIKEKLNEAKIKRNIYQHQRQKLELPVVSLVGYTSSGKTTLFNLLTAEFKETSPNLFTTLSTTTRLFKDSSNNKNFISTKEQNGGRGRGRGRGEILIVDTVGFISRLPPYMIDAFKSTLEESLVADLILLLIDSSEKIEDIRIKYSNCLQVLEELNADKSKLFIILTKVDKVDTRLINETTAQLNMTNNNVMAISSITGYGIHKLKTLLMKKLSEEFNYKKTKVNS
jgi:GTP-binding protein HflX